MLLIFYFRRDPVFKVGDLVRWREPIDEDYSYGTIVDIQGKTAIVREAGYYAGNTKMLNSRFIEKVKRGGKGYGCSKKHYK